MAEKRRQVGRAHAGPSLDAHSFGLLCAAVAATVASHVRHLPVWLWLPLAGLIALRWWSRRRRQAGPSAWIRLPLTGLLLVLVALHYGNLFGRDPGSMLGCGLLVLKLLETERPRDARVAVGFAAFVLMSALLFDQSLVFTLLASLVLLLLLAVLVALQPALPAGRPRLAHEFRFAATLLAVGLPLAAAAFVLVPRLASPLWGAPGDSVARTGLSESMAPGSMTELLIDDSPAMRVDFDTGAPPPPAQRYFRALVLWDFDGTTWTRNRRPAAREELVAQDAPLVYRMTLEPSDSHWLPALDVPLDAPEGARLTAERLLFSPAAVIQPKQYRLQSATSYRLAPQADLGERERGLALPEGYNPQARALAGDWRQRYGDDGAAVAQAALALFHERFSYTLNPPPLGRNTVDEFLFDTRRGFCEHYASAFTFLMRAAGFPARVVTGYQGGWWNATYGYLLVRQSDAHAWSEVWLGERGWVRFDPTAAVDPVRIELGGRGGSGSGGLGGDWLRGLQNRFDIVNRLWTQGVLNFNALRQKGLLTSFGVADPAAGDLLLALAGLLSFAMLLATAWALAGGAKPSGDTLDRAWRRLLAQLARRGVRHAPNEGPLAFLQRMETAAPLLAREADALIREYARLRYAANVPPPAEVAGFARRVRALRLPKVAPLAHPAPDARRA